MNRKLGFICKSAFYSAMRNFRSHKPCGLCVQNSGTALRLLHHTPAYICSIWAHISVSHIFLLTFFSLQNPDYTILYHIAHIPSVIFWILHIWSVKKKCYAMLICHQRFANRCPHVYTIQVTHALHERDYVNRVNFCQAFLQLINQNQELVNNLLMSDEAHFHLPVYNKFFSIINVLFKNNELH
jgi:hypothetical protein